MRRPALALTLAAMALVACQAGTPSSTPSAQSPSAGMRTYAKTIQPITSGQGCKTCHNNGAGSSYAFDSAHAATIARMANTNGKTAGLNAEQIADIQAWFAAGAPNDPQTF